MGTGTQGGLPPGALDASFRKSTLPEVCARCKARSRPPPSAQACGLSPVCQGDGHRAAAEGQTHVPSPLSPRLSRHPWPRLGARAECGVRCGGRPWLQWWLSGGHNGRRCPGLHCGKGGPARRAQRGVARPNPCLGLPGAELRREGRSPPDSRRGRSLPSQPAAGTGSRAPAAGGHGQPARASPEQLPPGLGRPSPSRGAPLPAGRPRHRPGWAPAGRVQGQSRPPLTAARGRRCAVGRPDGGGLALRVSPPLSKVWATSAALWPVGRLMGPVTGPVRGRSSSRWRPCAEDARSRGRKPTEVAGAPQGSHPHGVIVVPDRKWQV